MLTPLFPPFKALVIALLPILPWTFTAFISFMGSGWGDIGPFGMGTFTAFGMGTFTAFSIGKFTAFGMGPFTLFGTGALGLLDILGVFWTLAFLARDCAALFRDICPSL